jgi:hypothetical protein
MASGSVAPTLAPAGVGPAGPHAGATSVGSAATAGGSGPGASAGAAATASPFSAAVAQQRIALLRYMTAVLEGRCVMVHVCMGGGGR